MLPLAPLALWILTAPAAAHIAMWHPSMYGFRPNDKDYNSASDPMYNRPFRGVPELADGQQKVDSNGHPVWREKGWWFRGDYAEPPAAGEFLEVPAGGRMPAVIANHKNLTPWSWNRPNDVAFKYAAWCDAGCSDRYSNDGMAGMLHLPMGENGQKLSTPIEEVKTTGCAFAIAYSSDIDQIKPEDFVVISIYAKCPFLKNIEFEIPAGLPECPPEGCHCMWGWVHDTTGSMENYLTGFRCKVTGGGNRVIGKPQVARNCDDGGCQAGPKQLHYWLQKEGNNNDQPWEHPPFYNEQYGFSDGAQEDIFVDSGSVSASPASASTSAPASASPVTVTVTVTHNTCESAL